MARFTKKSKQTVLVDLSRGAIKLALAETAGEAVRFHDISRIEVADGQGGSQEAALITAAIRGEVRKNGWQGMPAACLLAGHTTSTQSFLFPPMPRADLRRAIELKLRETLHFDLSEATFDYRSLAMPDLGEGAHVLSLVAVAQRQAVQRGLAILQGADLRAVAVGAAAESLANLSRNANLCQAHEVTVHVDLGGESAIVNLFEGTALRFSREIDTAGDAFTRSLLRPILTPKGPVQLTHVQAQHVQRVAGYPSEGESLDLPFGIQASDLLPLLEPVAQRLSSELSRSLDYLRGITGRPQVDRIVLSGSAGSMRRLDSWLQESLGTPVTYVDPVARAMWHWRLAVCDQNPPELADFSAILGFSLGDQRPINLIPREDRLERFNQRVAKARKVLVPTSLAVGSCLSLTAVPVLNPSKASTQVLLGDSALLSRSLEEVAQEREQVEGFRTAMREVTQTRGPSIPWQGLLLDLAAAMPAEAMIDALRLDFEDGTPTLLIEVRVHEATGDFEPILTQLTSRLNLSPFFGELQVLDASLDGDSEEGVFSASLQVLGREFLPGRLNDERLTLGQVAP